MDIAKYIGLFLLKNKYCHIQGLGNLELRKKPGSYDGSALQAGSYEAVWTQTGSIDDAFPNFIATNEHVSIAKASNEIREFIIYAKAELAAGRDVVIPAVGKYTNKNGVQVFELDPSFSYQPQSIAANIITIKPQESDASVTSSFSHYNDNENGGKSKVNWGLIILWSAVLVGVITGVIFAVRYFVNQPGKDNTAAVVHTQDTVILSQAPVVDTAIKAPDTAKGSNPADTLEYNIALNMYKTLAAAQKREKQLLSFGHHVNITTKDSALFYVMMTIRSVPVDTLRVKDSLSNLFNKTGVSIIQ